MAIVIRPLFIKMKKYFTNSAGNHQRISYWTHCQTVYVDSDSEKGDVDEDDKTKYFRTLEDVLAELYYLIDLAGTDVVREPGAVGQQEAINHGPNIETSWIVVNGKGAIPECYTHEHRLWFDVEATLQQATNNITIADDRIKENSVVDLYVSIFGVSPSDMKITDGHIALKFSTQKKSMDIKARVWY